MTIDDQSQRSLELSKSNNDSARIRNSSDTPGKEYLPTPVTPALEYPQLNHQLKKDIKINNKTSSAISINKSGYSTFSVMKAATPSSSQNSSPSTAATNKGTSTAPPTAATNSSSADSTKPYPCPECHQTFSRPHNLKSHLTTHSSERPFQCDVCNHHFRRHHDLKRHQKLHTGERPYVCKDCYRSFARLDALNRHRRAEGGTACSAVHHQQINKQQQQRPALVAAGSSSLSSMKSVTGSTPTRAATAPTPTVSATRPPIASNSNTPSSTAPYSRPVIPQLHIPHPASHLYPKDFQPSRVVSSPSPTNSTSTNNIVTPSTSSNTLNIPSLAPTVASTANAASKAQSNVHSSSRSQLLPSPNALPNLPITDNLTPIYNQNNTSNGTAPIPSRNLPTTPLSPPTATSSGNNHTKKYHYHPPHSKSPLYHPYPHSSSFPQTAQSWSPSYFRVQQHISSTNSNNSNNNSSFSHCSPPTSNCSPVPLTLPPLSSASSASPPASTAYQQQQTQPPSVIDRLQQENEALKRDLDQIRAMAQRDTNTLKARIHDLEVENKVLRSLIHNSSSPPSQHQQPQLEDDKMKLDNDLNEKDCHNGYAHNRTASQSTIS